MNIYLFKHEGSIKGLRVNGPLLLLADLFLSEKDNYVSHLLKTDKIVNGDGKKRFKLNLRGGFVSIADKGIAIVILPHSWYQLQFARMLENPSYSLTNLNEVRCVEWLKTKISDFMSTLTKDEKWLFKQHFKWDVKEPKIACIKLLAKLHKTKEKPCPETVSYTHLRAHET